MAQRTGKPLTWAQRATLDVLNRRGRYLRQDPRSKGWRLSTGKYVQARLVAVLIEERAVEPSTHLHDRVFRISDRGRAVLETHRW